MDNISVQEMIRENWKAYNGVAVETTDDLNRLMLDGYTWNWIVSKSRITKQEKIIIVSRSVIGK